MSSINTFDTVADILQNNARNHPEKVATIYGGIEYNFSTHHKRALRLANALSELGCKPKDRVAILAKNCIEYLEVYHACEIAGYIIVPVNFRLAIKEIAYILENTSPLVCFYSSEYRDSIESVKAQGITLPHLIEVSGQSNDYQERINSASSRNLAYMPNKEDPVCIIHTSGTTGMPKGAILTQGALCGIAKTISQDAKIESSDYALVIQPFFHVGALFLQLAHHISGATIQVEHGFDPARVWQLLSDKQITTLQLVPTMLDMLLAEIKEENYPETNLKTIFYSTAPINENLLRQGLNVFGQVFIQQYGSTEAGQITSLAKEHHVKDGDELEQRWLRSAGKVNPGIELRIIDDNGKEARIGQPGEITVSHPNITQGYWNDTESTANTIKNGYLHMGDIGYLDENDFLYIVDRKKDMIISGGENIYPREVEATLNEHPDVVDAAVIGIPDDRWGEAVLAFIVRKPETTVTEEDIIAYCKEQIASYKKPKKVEFVETLPRIATGKIDKVSLRKPYWENQERNII